MISRGSAQSLVEFAFQSRLGADLSDQVLVRLERECWAYNVRSGITGELRRVGDRIEQVIEGPAAVVLSLASRIMTDKRHGEIAVRALRAIDARAFDGWSSVGFAAGEDGSSDRAASVANVVHLSALRRAPSHAGAPDRGAVELSRAPA